MGSMGEGFAQGVQAGTSNYYAGKANTRAERQLQLKEELQVKQTAQMDANLKNTQQANEIQARQVQAIEKLDADAKQKNANISRNLVSKYIEGEANNKDIINSMKNNPDAWAPLGIQNPDTVHTPAYNDDSMQDYLKKHFPITEWHGYSEDNADQAERDTMEVGYNEYTQELYDIVEPYLVSADGKIVDTSQLYKIMGAPKATLSKDQERIEQIFAGVHTKVTDANTAPKAQSSYMQVFNAWDEETDPAKKTELKAQLDKLSTAYTPSKAKGTELTQLLEWQEANPDEVADNTDRAKATADRIKMLTTYKPVAEPAAIREQKSQAELNKKQFTNVSDYMTGTEAQPAFDMTTPSGDIDMSIESDTAANKKLYTTELKKEVKESKGHAKMVKAVGRLETIMADPSYESGYFDNALQWVSTVTPEYIMKADVKQIAAEANISVEVAAILKEISGAAASDSERDAVSKMVAGLAEMDESARLATVQAYLANQQEKIATNATSLAEQGMPKTAKEIYSTSQYESKASKSKAKATDDPANIADTLKGW